MSKIVPMHSAVTTIDTTSFEALFHTHYDGLVRYCHTMVKDYDDAYDIVQSVFTDLWSDRHKTEIHTSIQAYLYKAVYFKCMNALKHQKVQEKHASEMSFFDHQNTGNPAMYSEVKDKIYTAIQSLPDQCKKIFMLSRYDGLKYNEIAQTLDLSPKTIENQMGKALKTMRVALADYLKIIVLFFTSF